MALNDDLDRQPIPPPIYSVLVGARVVTLPPGLEVFHVVGAFWVGGRTFRQLKAIGDLAERLRGATTLLRRSIGADHFEGRNRLADIEAIVVEETKAYTGRVPGVDGEVFYIPGEADDGARPPGEHRRAVRIVRRVVIRWPFRVVPRGR